MVDSEGPSLGSRVVQTVLGPIHPHDLGIVLPHEHIWMDARPLRRGRGPTDQSRASWDANLAAEARWDPGVHEDNYRPDAIDVVVEELRRLVVAGGRTVVELTPPSLGRDPLRLREIARRSGLHVVMGTGQYIAEFHEPWVADASESEIARRLVSDLMDGVDGSAVRAGILGEIGTSNPLVPVERRVLRAVTAVARETGRSISIHLHPWGRQAEAVLDVLSDAGVDPTRVILGHLNTAIDDPVILRRLADRGAVLGFDLFGFDHSLLGPGRWPPSDHDVAAMVADLVDEGYARSIVLSQDIGVRTRLRRWGGWGYAHLLEHVVPILRDAGVDDGALSTMLVDTPARLLSVPN